MQRFTPIRHALVVAALLPTVRAAGGDGSVAWKACLRQPAAWYASDEAARVADNVLLYQRDNGGWDKNVDMARPLDDPERALLRSQKAGGYSTIDNGATHTQLRFLAKVVSARDQHRYREAFLRGLDYLLSAQYPNGGWPQYYPPRKGYYTHITFNDDAMVGVLTLLRDVSGGRTPYSFIDAPRRERARRAVQRGIDCILKYQVIVGGQKTVWCAQHDETTLAPAPARTYEKVSLSGSESVGVVRFLMGIDKPDASVREAVESAVAWFRRSRITGVRVERRPAPDTPKGYDTVAVADPSAPPVWARFYELESNRPLFCGRDGIVKYSLAEIEYERRNGYRWYVDRPAQLLDRDYPRWIRSLRPD